MHSVGVILIASQVTEIGGKELNIHDVYSVKVNGKGVIVNAYMKPDGADEFEYMKRAEGSLLNDDEEAKYREVLKAKGLEY